MDDSEEEVEFMVSQNRFKKKVCLLGDGAVGKTSLIRRYVFDDFDDMYITTIGAKVTKKVLVKKAKETNQQTKLTLMIWDILGQRGLQQLHNMYYASSHAAMLVCDYTRRETFEALKTWRTDLFGVTKNVPIILLVNKIDLKKQGQIKMSEIEDLAKEWKCDYFLTSAKTGENVERSFKRLGNQLIKLEMAKGKK